jgi:hypothetical protein
MANDRDYYYRRAETELEQAQRATLPAAVKAHYTLAGHYLDRVYGGGEADATVLAPAADSVPSDQHTSPLSIVSAPVREGHDDPSDSASPRRLFP